MCEIFQCMRPSRKKGGLTSSFLPSKNSPLALAAFLAALKYSSLNLASSFTPETSTCLFGATAVSDRTPKGEGDEETTHLGGGGDNVGLVHAAEGNAVKGVRAGDEEEARGECLEEDHALVG